MQTSDRLVIISNSTTIFCDKQVQFLIHHFMIFVETIDFTIKLTMSIISILQNDCDVLQLLMNIEIEKIAFNFFKYQTKSKYKIKLGH